MHHYWNSLVCLPTLFLEIIPETIKKFISGVIETASLSLTIVNKKGKEFFLMNSSFRFLWLWFHWVNGKNYEGITIILYSILDLLLLWFFIFHSFLKIFWGNYLLLWVRLNEELRWVKSYCFWRVTVSVMSQIQWLSFYDVIRPFLITISDNHRNSSTVYI